MGKKRLDEKFSAEYPVEEGLIVLYYTINSLYHYYDGIYSDELDTALLNLQKYLEEKIMPSDMCINGYDFDGCQLYRKTTYKKSDIED